MATGVKPGVGATAPEESLWDVDFEKADLRIGARRTRDLCIKNGKIVNSDAQVGRKNMRSERLYHLTVVVGLKM